MNKVFKLFAIALILVSAVSCDSFRRLVGRPTSSDLEAKMRKLEVIQAAAVLAAERSGQDPNSLPAQYAAQYTSQPQAAAPAQYPGAPVQTSSAPVQYTAPAQTQAQAPVQYTAPVQTQAQAPVQYNAPVQTQAQAPVQYNAPVQTQAQAPVQYAAPVQTQPQAPVQYTAPAQTQAYASNASFAISIGCFGVRSNAERQLSIASSRGYSVNYGSAGNLTSVLVLCPGSTMQEAEQFLMTLRREAFCPVDAFVKKII